MFMLWFLLIALVLGAAVGVTYAGVKKARGNAKSKKNNEDTKEESTEEKTQERARQAVKERERVEAPEQQRAPATRTPAQRSAGSAPKVVTEPEKVIEGRAAPTRTVIQNGQVVTEPEKVIEGRAAPDRVVIQDAEVTPEAKVVPTPEQIAQVLTDEEAMNKVVVPYAKVSKRAFINIEDYVTYFLQEAKLITNEKGERVHSPTFLKKLDIVDLLNDKEAMNKAKLYAQARKQNFTRRIDIATFFITEKGNALDAQSPEFEKTMKKLGFNTQR